MLRSRFTASSMLDRTSPVAFSPAARRSSIAFWTLSMMPPPPLASTLNLLADTSQFAERSLLRHKLRGELLEVDHAARHLGQELLGVDPLPLGPEGAQPLSCLRALEPAIAESLAERLPPAHLERPRSQVAGNIEAGVD